MKQNKANTQIENWWRHLGRWDLESLTGIHISECDGDIALFFDATDEWWNSLNPVEKEQEYMKFTEING